MAVVGRITDIDRGHGYGFIKQDNHEDKVFFHIKDIKNALVEPQIDELVVFDVESDYNGCRLAINISTNLMK